LISAGAPPQTLLGELTAVPKIPSLFKGPTAEAGRRRRGREGGAREKCEA